MAATHGKNTGVVVNENDLSAFFNEADISGEAEIIDVTTFTNQSKRYIVGYRDGKVSLKGLFGSKDPLVSSDPKETDDVLRPILGDDTIAQNVLIAIEGLSVFGNSVSFFLAKQSKYSVTSPYNGVVSVMSDLTADRGISVGPLLLTKQARTVAGSSPAYDMGAATTKGFIAQINTLAVGATTSANIIIEDSADGATGWATIGSFTAASIAGAERIETNGAVRRYVRASWTFTGANGATFVVSFALQK